MKNRKNLTSKCRKDSAEIVEKVSPRLIEIIQEIRKLLKKEAKGSPGNRREKSRGVYGAFSIWGGSIS